MARPRLLNQELVDKMQGYLDNFEPDEDKVIPSIEDLALHSKVCRASIYGWCDELQQKQELEGFESQFLDIVEGVSIKQASLLMNKGLMGDFNSSITKLLLFKHGHSEKSEVQQDTSLVVEITKDFD